MRNDRVTRSRLAGAGALELAGKSTASALITFAVAAPRSRASSAVILPSPPSKGFDVVGTPGPTPAFSTTDRWRIAVGGSGDPGHDSGSCTSVAVSHSSDRSAAGSPVDCSSGLHRCGPPRTRGADPTTRRSRRKSRSSPTERSRDTAGCNDPGECRSTPRRIRANASYSSPAGTTPDMHCRSRFSGCASKVAHRIRDRASRRRNYDPPPTNPSRIGAPCQN